MPLLNNPAERGIVDHPMVDPEASRAKWNSKTETIVLRGTDETAAQGRAVETIEGGQNWGDNIALILVGFFFLDWYAGLTSAVGFVKKNPWYARFFFCRTVEAEVVVNVEHLEI